MTHSTVPGATALIAIDPNRTPYDVNFTLFGVPVRIHPFFWLAQVFLSLDPKPIAVLVWTIAVFISLIVHEFGHVAAFRYFRSSSHVVLYAFGGLTVPNSAARRSTHEQVIISLAGPVAGFILFGLIAGVAWSTGHLLFWMGQESGLPIFATTFFPAFEISTLDRLLDDLLYCNFYWSVFNLLPILPLDGGQISRALLGAWRRDGQQLSFLVSAIAGGALALAAWIRWDQKMMAIMLVWLAWDSFAAYQRLSRPFEEYP
ncbi:MAG TPA: site-2 protease family protein [Pirellulales bacterium]|nr:site-2 protease family protein [Pirellulales bacterium]